MQSLLSGNRFGWTAPSAVLPTSESGSSFFPPSDPQMARSLDCQLMKSAAPSSESGVFHSCSWEKANPTQLQSPPKCATLQSFSKGPFRQHARCIATVQSSSSSSLTNRSSPGGGLKVDVFFPQTPRLARPACVRTNVNSSDIEQRPPLRNSFELAAVAAVKSPLSSSAPLRRRRKPTVVEQRDIEIRSEIPRQSLRSAESSLPECGNSMEELQGMTVSATPSLPRRSPFATGWGFSVSSKPLVPTTSNPDFFQRAEEIGEVHLPRVKAYGKWGAPGGPPVTLVSDGDLFECLQRQLEALRREPTVLESKSIRFKCAGSFLERSGVEYSVIEEGTFARVFEGRREEDGLDVAIKVPGGALSSQPLQLLQRTLNEWKVLSRCQHPGIVPLVGAIVQGPLDVWIVTGRAPGEDLHSLRLRRMKEGRGFSPRESLRMCRCLASTLSYLHRPEAGKKEVVVHMDVKPENLVVSSDCFVRICDFGDAQETTDGRVSSVTGATWLYAPPEVLRAKWASPNAAKKNVASGPVGEFDDRWDVWSMGCVFVEMFGYRHPLLHLLQGVPLESNALYSHLRVLALEGKLRPEIPSEIGSFMHQIVSACLEADPRKRPSAEEVFNALSIEDEHILCDLRMQPSTSS